MVRVHFGKSGVDLRVARQAHVKRGVLAGLIGAIAALNWSVSPTPAAGLTEPSLVIKIENVSPQGGELRVALFDRASYDGHVGKPVAEITATAHAPETIVTLKGLKPGNYAVKMYQDVGRTGVFATTRLGTPAEPFGFSNDAIPILDQPSFDSAKFELTPEPLSIVVHLRQGL